MRLRLGRGAEPAPRNAPGRLGGEHHGGVRSAHAEAVRSLPPHHTDPFGRLLVVQALLEGAVLVTADRKLRPYAVPLLET